MEQRHNPYSRPPDPPLIHNPSHQQPPASQQPPGPQYHSAATSSQPSYQMPPSDPFQRRAPDPFLPQPHSQRRGSYGLPARRDGGAPVSHAAHLSWTSTAGSNPNTPGPSSHHHSGPPPPPALSQPLSGPSSVAFAHEHARRRSIGGHSPPRYYASVSSSEPPPPPNAFISRQMPPPSPSQQPPPGPAYQGPRGPPPPPPFTSGRELPGLGSRGPGAGMSISSILGDGPAAPPSGQSLHGSPIGNSQSPPSGTQQPASPHRRGHSMTSKLGDFGSWRRPHTPDRHHLPAGIRAEGASYSANSSPAHYANIRRSPEFPRAGPPLFPPPHQAGSVPRPYQGSPNAGPERDPTRHLEDRVPPRPSSQPAGLAGLPHYEGPPRETIPSLGTRPPFGQYRPTERRDDGRLPTSSSYELNPSIRDRPVTVEPLGQPSYSPRRDPRDTMPPREVPKEEMRREIGGRDDHAGPFRTGFRHQPYQPRGMIPPTEAPRSHPQIGSPFDRPRDAQPGLPPQDRAIPSIDPLSRDDRRTSDPHAQLGDTQYRNLMHEHQPLLMQRSRSSIGLEGKRGRASPMPQAVQGAQMQPTGAGSDPNIKSEFGRIFQGLGSGLGGSITPSRGSPMPQRHPSNAEGEPIVLSDGDGVPRSGSVSKRHKRVKEEDARYEDDGRGTPLARGGKRMKAGHHHHLHQHNHPHHHHVHGHLHRPEDPIGPNSSAHHHHHIHTSHHHHHSPLAPRAQAATPVPPMPKPLLHISSQAVLDSVSHLVRRHLGSELYEPTITLPPAAMASHSYDPSGYFVKYKPSRTFEEKDFNCTLTVRVPRYYLTQEMRENITRNRLCVGSGVYTDDSDPVAVAVHEGWLRGAWSEDVDAEMLDIPSTTAPAGDDAVTAPQTEYASKPAAPVSPQEDKDLHLTMLILPALKNYSGSVRYGMRSRDWNNKEGNHDGVSWTVVKMRWVDEAGSSGVKRSAQARRERLEGMRTEAAMALLGLAGNAGVRPVVVA